MYENGRKYYTAEQVADFAIRDIKAKGRNAFTIESPSDAPEGYYVIALKTSDKVSPNTGVCDYHFAVRIDVGIWADKPGKGSPSRFGYISVSSPSWDI